MKLKKKVVQDWTTFFYIIWPDLYYEFSGHSEPLLRLWQWYDYSLQNLHN